MSVSQNKNVFSNILNEFYPNVQSLAKQMLLPDIFTHRKNYLRLPLLIISELTEYGIPCALTPQLKRNPINIAPESA